MIKVGLTGNIGSGKTTIARIFEIMGVPVYHADLEAKKFLLEKSVKNILLGQFGEDILFEDEIDRPKLAQIVFNDKEALSFLNNTIHPLVKEDFDNWMISKQDQSYIIQEAAILYESGFYRFFDRTIFISCPELITLERIMHRDGIDESAVRSRMNNQWPEDKKIPLADYIILNDGSELVIPQVLRFHNILSAL